MSKEKEIRVLLINPREKKREIVTIGNNLESFLKHLGCDKIDLALRAFGEEKRLYNVLFDEEYLSKEDPKIAIVTVDPKDFRNYSIMAEPIEVIAGTLFICNHDENNNLSSLTDNDILYLGGCLMPTTYFMEATI